MTTMKHWLGSASLALGSIGLAACGGGGGGSSQPTPPPVVVVPNAPPTVSVSNTPGPLREGTMFTADVSAADSDNDPLTTTVTVTSGPDLGLTVSGGTISGTAPDVDADSTSTVRVTVSDGEDSASTTFDVTTLNNAAPQVTLTATPGSVAEGLSVLFDASASTDAEGDPLTYTYVQIAGPTVDVSGTGDTLGVTLPDVDTDAVLTVEVQVSDGRDVTTSRADVTVEDIRQTPLFGVPLDVTSETMVSGEIADISSFLNPSNQGLFAVADTPGGPAELRSLVVRSSSQMDEGVDLLPQTFAQPLQLQSEDRGLFTIIEPDGISFVSQDTSVSEPRLDFLGKLDVDAPCALSFGFDDTSAGRMMIVGKQTGVDLYSYDPVGPANGDPELDFATLTLQASVNDGKPYCGLTKPNGVGTPVGTPFTTNVLAFEAGMYEIQRFEIADDGMGTLSLSPEMVFGNPALGLVGAREVVRSQTDPNRINTMAVIVTDGQRVGSHSVQYIVQDFSTSEVRIHTGDWTLGVPTDLTFVQFDPNGPEYIVVSTPGVPQAVSVEVPDFNDPSGPLDVSFLEVGLGASVVHGREGAVGDTRDNDFDGLFFGDSVNAEVRRFDSSDAP